MKLASVALDKTNKFSSLFLDYISEKNSIKEFYTQYPKVDNFEEQIKNKKFSAENRKILCQVLNDQYQQLNILPQVQKNIELLENQNTFTVTTGHQLNIFTGPLYFIYKIVSVINICKQLAKRYPTYNFVPVYWMASEDHDFDEISYFRLNAKKYKWSTEQKGAVGRFDTKEIAQLANEIPGIPDFFKTAYKKSKTLAEAVRMYVNDLFEEEGLIVLDADDHQLKGLFKEVIKDDIFNNSAKSLVDECSKNIEEKGYKTQIHPREINFFYLENDIRERIEKVGDKFKVLDTTIEFDENEIAKLIEEEPEKFSPNVVLRPLYQETILPNLAYIGGPAEVAYWFQLKSLFVHFKTQFPILMPRNFAMVVPNHILKKVKKINVSWDLLFKDKNELHKTVVLENSTKKVMLNGQINEMVALFEKIKKQAEDIDFTLLAHVEAQSVKTKTKLENIEKKFVRAEKRKHQDKIDQIDSVLDNLFPNGGLQERTDNFLNFYLENPNFIRQLINDFDPFDYRLHILSNGEQTNA